MGKVTYYIDGIDLTAYGVYVSSSEGLLDRPKAKARVSVDWPGYHGKAVDLSKKYYGEREISLDCFLKATSKEDYVAKMNTFLQLFDQPGTRRLMVSVDASKPLLYEVYSEDKIKVKKEWSDSEMVGEFTLDLIEMSPVKRILSFTATDGGKQVSITITTPKLVDVYWGDGSTTLDVSGTSYTFTHTYATNGVKYIIIAGNIDEITSMTTTGIELWSKL